VLLLCICLFAPLFATVVLILSVSLVRKCKGTRWDVWMVWVPGRENKMSCETCSVRCYT